MRIADLHATLPARRGNFEQLWATRPRHPCGNEAPTGRLRPPFKDRCYRQTAITTPRSPRCLDPGIKLPWGTATIPPLPRPQQPETIQNQQETANTVSLHLGGWRRVDRLTDWHVDRLTCWQESSLHVVEMVSWYFYRLTGKWLNVEIRVCWQVIYLKFSDWKVLRVGILDLSSEELKELHVWRFWKLLRFRYFSLRLKELETL